LSITINPSAVVRICLQTDGWQDIQPGTLQIDVLDMGAHQPPMQASGQVLYGFTCIHESGAVMTGRLTALLAVREAQQV